MLSESHHLESPLAKAEGISIQKLWRLLDPADLKRAAWEILLVTLVESPLIAEVRKLLARLPAIGSVKVETVF